MAPAPRLTETGPRLLRAGPLSAVLDGPALRWIRFRGQEVVRAIQPTTRDRDWRTISAIVERIAVDEPRDGEGACATLALRMNAPGVSVESELTVDCRTSGRLVVDYVATAVTPTTVQRLGLVVLLPAGAAGASFAADGPAGPVSGLLPVSIEDERVVTDCERLAWHPSPDLEARLTFEGPLWEIEDQRAWSDASFKAYSPPLRVPHPVALAPGTTQKVRVTLDVSPAAGRASRRPSSSATTGAVRVTGSAIGVVPPIGTGWTRPLADHERADLAAMRVGHLRVVVDHDDPDWRATLAAAGDDARVLGCPLELELVGFGDDAALAEVAAATNATSRIAGVLVFGGDGDDGLVTSSAASIARARAAFQAAHRPPPVGGGTRANLAELLARRPPVDGCDRVSLAVSPQVHADDDATILENAGVVGDVLARAAAAAGGRPLTVACSLRPRFNAYAQPPERSLPVDGGDPRFAEPIGTAWLITTLAGAFQAPPARLTIGEATGPGGMAGTPERSPTGVRRVLRAAPAGSTLHSVDVSGPVAAFAVTVGGSVRIVLANGSGRRLGVRWFVDEIGTGSGTVNLGPYGSAIVELSATTSSAALL